MNSIRMTAKKTVLVAPDEVKYYGDPYVTPLELFNLSKKIHIEK